MRPVLEFDKLDVFTTSGGQHIIYLTASKPSEQLLAIVNTLRSELEAEEALKERKRRAFRNALGIFS